MHRLSVCIKNLLSMIWQDFINLLHLADSKPKDARQKAHVNALVKDGILFFDDFLDKGTCDDLAEKLLKLTANKTKSETLESGTYINLRNEGDKNASDYGMVDVFYVDQEFPEIKNIDVRFVEKLLAEAHNQEVIKLKTHAYINQGVQGTRGFHTDNTQPVLYKAFVYLTDVEDTSFGPYSFIKGTQRFSWMVYKNLILNFFKRKGAPTDMPSVNQKNLVNCIAPKGTLILSNQNGIHRGLPQDLDKRRIALVFNFTILSKLSYLHKTARQKLAKARASA